MIENVKEFRPELYGEVLRNLLDRLVLKNGEIQVRRPRPSQEIAARSATKIEACQGREVSLIDDPPPKGRWCQIAVGRPKRGVGCGGDRKALSLDIVVGVPRIGERCTTRGVQTIRKGP